MTREEILKSNAYWYTHTQTELRNLLVVYMNENNIDVHHIARHLGIKRRTIRKIWKWKDIKMSELTGLAVKLGYRIEFTRI